MFSFLLVTFLVFIHIWWLSPSFRSASAMCIILAYKCINVYYREWRNGETLAFLLFYSPLPSFDNFLALDRLVFPLAKVGYAATRALS